VRVEEKRLVRACAELGATWTCVGSIAFALEVNAALAGRRAFVDSFGAGGAFRQWSAVLLVVGCGLAWAGVALKLRSDAPSIQGYRRLQYVTMPLALVFLLVHAWLTWLGAALGTDPGSIYEGLRRALPSYAMIGVYVVGLSALALAMEQALLVWVAATGIVSRPVTMRWFRVAAAALPLVLFVVSVNGIGHFVTGRGLFWRPEVTESEQSVAPDAPEPPQRPSPVGMPEGDPEPEPEP